MSRFDILKAKLGKRPGVTNPGALAAFIGRKKYGNAGMARLSAAGRRKVSRKRRAVRRTRDPGGYIG